MKTKRFRFRYPRSKFWLIFWLLVFLPIGLVLLTRLEYTSDTQIIRWDYQGNRFWLYFWAIFFCPISILLFVLKGSLTVTDQTSEALLS